MDNTINLLAAIQADIEAGLLEKVMAKVEQHSLKGKWWRMSDLEAHLGYKDDWIKDRLLYNPRWRKLLDVEFGGFVFYPESGGERWTFHAERMAQFVSENFAEIFKKAS